MAKKDQPGQLNLVGIFEAHAARLMSAAAEGKLLTRTKNIADAGNPVEEEVRSLFSRLPGIYSVTSGYLFNEESKCTPQIDIVVIDQREAHRLGPPSATSYVPFFAARALGEAKNGVSGTLDGLKQMTARIESWRKLKSSSWSLYGNSGDLSIIEPCYFVVIAGDYSDLNKSALKKIIEWYQNDKPKPDYVLFAGDGTIIANKQLPNAGAGEIVSFYDRHNYGKYFICRPENTMDVRGRALLWMYFAVTAGLNVSVGNNAQSMPLIRAADKLYNIKTVTELY